MSAAVQEISVFRTRLALALLLVVDALTFVTVGGSAEGLRIGLAASVLALVQLGVDLVLGAGLFLAKRWATELARYRCILGVCFLVFLWLDFFLTQDLGAGLSLRQTVTAGIVRDAILGTVLPVVLFLLRREKRPSLPRPEPEDGSG